MQAIRVKYLGPTNHRGTRLVAKCEAMRIVVQWDYGLNTGDNHTRAAAALVSELNWPEYEDNYTMGWFDGDSFHVQK